MNVLKSRLAPRTLRAGSSTCEARREPSCSPGTRHAPPRGFAPCVQNFLNTRSHQHPNWSGGSRSDPGYCFACTASPNVLRQPPASSSHRSRFCIELSPDKGRPLCPRSHPRATQKLRWVATEEFMFARRCDWRFRSPTLINSGVVWRTYRRSTCGRSCVRLLAGRGRTHASMPWVSKRTAPHWTRGMTARRSRCFWPRTALTRSVRPSVPAAKVAQSRSPASMADGWTSLA